MYVPNRNLSQKNTHPFSVNLFNLEQQYNACMKKAEDESAMS